MAILVFRNEMVSSVLGDVWGRGHPMWFTFEPAAKALIDVGFIVDDVSEHGSPKEKTCTLSSTKRLSMTQRLI